MIEINNFHILTDESGTKSLRSQVYPSRYAIMNSLFSMYSSKNELLCLKQEILKTKGKQVSSDVGQNSLSIYINGETTKIRNVYRDDEATEIATGTILKFIDEAIEFHIKYDSGKIPGIIPMSKSNDWVVVPKEYVKDEYRNNDVAAGE